MANKKTSGQIFTPIYLVRDILDTTGYTGSVILEKHIIDNSCGNGAFLVEIVNRYITEFLNKSDDFPKLRADLGTYIHGIEIDAEMHYSCIEKLQAICNKYNLGTVHWNILCSDALAENCFSGKMDFVVGNPPYVRVHNLDNYKSVKKFSFSDGGMTDLYLVFFEIGFRMLKKGGFLCYITPISWINSIAGKKLRSYILKSHNLVKLIDLGHFQAFEATTYTLISLFQKGTEHAFFDYFIYKTDKGAHHFQKVETLRIEEAVINGIMYLAKKETLSKIRTMTTTDFRKYVEVKNGFATLADDVFIRDCFPFSKHTIPTIKASTGKWRRALFPYDQNGKPITFKKLSEDKQIKKFYEENKEALLKGRKEEDFPDWYLYGRTQALKDVYRDKFSINSIINKTDSIKLNHVPNGCGIYGGLYILTSIEEGLLRDVLFSDDFIHYIASLKKYKSGGYYTFNSKELEYYLNYKLTFMLNDSSYVRQQDLFESNF